MTNATNAVAFTRRTLRKAMDEAGITGEISGRGSEIEVELPDDAAKDNFCKHIVQWGGYRTGYGAWVLRPGYVGRGDPGDPGSDWNYH